MSDAKSQGDTGGEVVKAPPPAQDSVATSAVEPIPGATASVEAPAATSSVISASANAPDGGDAAESSGGSDGVPKTDVDEMVEAVTLRAAELGKNVAQLATKAGLGTAVTDLSEKVSGFGTGFASLFSVFDTPPTLSPKGSSGPKGFSTTRSKPGSSLASAAAAASAAPSSADQSRRVASRAIDLQANFGLPPEESLLEAFPCKLVQSYACAHNSFTPEIPKAFLGTLYITEKNVCFLIEAHDRLIPIRLRIEDVTGVSREQPRGLKKGDRADASQDQLKLKLKPSAVNESAGSTSAGSPFPPDRPQWVSLGSFASVQDLESALALLEHLTGSE